MMNKSINKEGKLQKKMKIEKLWKKERNENEWHKAAKI